MVMVFHFAFLLFLAAGSLLAWRWPRLVAFHLPSVAWGLVSISAGLDCPLTPVEKQLRRSAGEQGYAGGFVDHYIEGVIYPEHYTPLLRVLIATAVVVGYLRLIRSPSSVAESPPAPAAIAASTAAWISRTCTMGVDSDSSPDATSGLPPLPDWEKVKR